MTVVVNDESKHSTFSRINIVICFIPCGGPTVICFIPCGSRAADPLDGHRNGTTLLLRAGRPKAKQHHNAINHTVLVMQALGLLSRRSLGGKTRYPNSACGPLTTGSLMCAHNIGVLCIKRVK
ncbi:hypothetical protein J6590_015401 [Homalodisca vitripennis]|nr:hypothetical protein J6590_015401 [Homalodisca vitripennis]